LRKQYAVEGSSDVVEVIVEAFVKFNSEITLLTVVQNNNPTLFCAPIGHRQEIIKKAGSLQQF
jgi:phosphoribosylglycinamide formyltransferase 2